MGMVWRHDLAWQYGFEGIVWRVNHQSHNRPQEANHKPTKPSPLVSSKKCTLLSCLISHKLFSPTFRLSCFQGKYGTDQDQGPGSRIMIKGHGQGSRSRIRIEYQKRIKDQGESSQRVILSVTLILLKAYLCFGIFPLLILTWM